MKDRKCQSMSVRARVLGKTTLQLCLHPMDDRESLREEEPEAYNYAGERVALIVKDKRKYGV